MAVVAVKSGSITNRDAIPSVINGRYLQGGNIQHARGVCSAANGDSIGSTYRFCSIPSNALVNSLRLSCPDIGTTGAMDIGLYRTTADGGAVVDADFFASAVSVSGGALSKVEQLYESGNGYTVAKGEQRVWEALGLTSDPRTQYDIVGTATAAQDAAGAMLVECDYIV